VRAGRISILILKSADEFGDIFFYFTIGSEGSAKGPSFIFSGKAGQIEGGFFSRTENNLYFQTNGWVIY
jgi:hypothetical protein